VNNKSRALSYVLMQFLLLGLLIVSPRSASPYGPLSGVLSSLGVVLIVTGVGIALFAFFGLGRALTASPIPKPDGQLVTTGLYARVRHPIYFGLLLAALGIVLDAGWWPQLAIATMLYVLLNIKASFEEQLLNERYPEYRNYAAKTPRLFPRLTS
jgi:protein-S-isoprenylcysteine O-methyltransferase Ste14